MPAAPSAPSAPAAPKPAGAQTKNVPPPEPDVPATIVDPHGMVPAIGRLSSGSLRAGRVALGILSALLEHGEVVDAIVQGNYQHQVAVAALTDRRVLLVNEHEWDPTVRSMPLEAELVVQGWQDDRSASLIFIHDNTSITFSLITDRPLAQDFAHRIRAKVSNV